MTDQEKVIESSSDEGLEARRQTLTRHARRIGHGVLNFAEDWANGTTHAATGGRLGMTMTTSRRLRHENALAHSGQQSEQE